MSLLYLIGKHNIKNIANYFNANYNTKHEYKSKKMNYI